MIYNSIREGVRGGKDLFKWDDVRLMTYKERECYLGASAKLGFLDKGGKWRKKDWWQSVKFDDQQLKDEKQKLILQEQGIINTHLEEVRTGKQLLNPLKKTSQLSDYEIKEITRRGTLETVGDLFDPKSESSKGLGYGITKSSIPIKKNDDNININKLEEKDDTNIMPPAKKRTQPDKSIEKDMEKHAIERKSGHNENPKSRLYKGRSRHY